MFGYKYSDLRFFIFLFELLLTANRATCAEPGLPRACRRAEVS